MAALVEEVEGVVERVVVMLVVVGEMESVVVYSGAGGRGGGE